MDLDPESDNIRLLRIKPPDPENIERALIECDLLDGVSLASHRGKYTTISYSAGDPHDIEIITVNGYSFNAFANLGHALRQARHFWKDRFDEQELLLWADQICINQSSHLERSHQVQLMGDIYSASAQVLVSLSTEHDIGGGIAWLEQISPGLSKAVISKAVLSKAVLSKTAIQRLSGDEDFDYEDPAHEFLYEGWVNEGFHLGWHAFVRTFLASSWWSRAWVRQEFFRSPVAYFMAAFESIHWKTAANLIDLYYNAVYSLEMTPLHDVDRSD